MSDILDSRDYPAQSITAGQLHDQVRKLPPGTKISGFKMVDGRLQLS